MMIAEALSALSDADDHELGAAGVEFLRQLMRQPAVFQAALAGQRPPDTGDLLLQVAGDVELRLRRTPPGLTALTAGPPGAYVALDVDVVELRATFHPHAIAGGVRWGPLRWQGAHRRAPGQPFAADRGFVAKLAADATMLLYVTRRGLPPRQVACPGVELLESASMAARVRLRALALLGEGHRELARAPLERLASTSPPSADLFAVFTETFERAPEAWRWTTPHALERHDGAYAQLHAAAFGTVLRWILPAAAAHAGTSADAQCALALLLACDTREDLLSLSGALARGPEHARTWLSEGLRELGESALRWGPQAARVLDVDGFTAEVTETSHAVRAGLELAGRSHLLRACRAPRTEGLRPPPGGA